MTITEFRAFLEGMDIKGTPTSEQWIRISEKIALLQDTPIISIPTVFSTPIDVPFPQEVKPYCDTATGNMDLTKL